MKVSAIIKGSICLFSLVGASNLLAAPANAGQGAARSAASVTRPSGVTESLSGEVLTPSGYYFQGIPAVVVAPPTIPGTTYLGITTFGGVPSYTYQTTPPLPQPIYIPVTPGSPGATLTITPTYTNAGKTNESLSGLSFNAGTPTAVSTAGTVAGVVVDILQSDNAGVKAPTIDGAAAIIKAGAGADGLE